MTTVPLLGSGRAASRTPTECLRAIRCTTGNPVCRPVRSSTSGTGPAKAAFSAATWSAPMPIPVSSTRNITLPSSSRCPLTVTVPGEYLVALSSRADISEPMSSAA